jgi:hypothetical protein
LVDTSDEAHVVLRRSVHCFPFSYSRAEWEVARRIINRAKKRRALTAKPYKENLRMILREIRRTNYQ